MTDPLATPTTRRVITAVAERFGVTVDHVLSRDRHTSTALARMVSLYVLREHRVPRPSFPELGRDFGIDHTTALSACRRILKRLGEDCISDAIEAGRVALTTETPRDTFLAKCHRREALRRELEELDSEIAGLVGSTPTLRAMVPVVRSVKCAIPDLLPVAMGAE